MFMGQYNHSVDTKGRVIIPAKFRDQLGDSFIITRGFDKCLYGYTREEWQKIEEKISALPSMDPKARMLTRFFLPSADTCELDKQGRILIPSHLREYAGLDKDVVFAGVAAKFELWSKDLWEKASLECEENMDEITQQLTSLGFMI